MLHLIHMIDTKCKGTACYKSHTCLRHTYEWMGGQAEKWISPPIVAYTNGRVDKDCEFFLTNAPFVRQRQPVDVPD